MMTCGWSEIWGVFYAELRIDHKEGRNNRALAAQSVVAKANHCQRVVTTLRFEKNLIAIDYFSLV
jgi:fructosamine-3-kinase